VAVVRVLAAPDKFKGSVSAHEVAAAIGHACWDLGVDCIEIPMADGGDGMLDVLGGANRSTTVTGPLGDPVTAGWRLAGGTAVIEMARASGLTLAGGADANDALGATTTGTGELIDHALDAGAKRIIVGLGGSATTDGGFGAIRAISAIARLRNVELLVACDVTTTFTDAAAVYGPQKGATEPEIKLLERRLERLVQMFEEDFAFDVTRVEGGGAAGGLGGALAALGGRLVPGVELVADELGVFDVLEATGKDRVDLIVTGEGRLDATSFAGKVVGGMTELGAEAGVPVVAVVGDADPDIVDEHRGSLDVVALGDLFGLDEALAEPKRSIERAVGQILRTRQG
jgi:glycerate kinase